MFEGNFDHKVWYNGTTSAGRYESEIHPDVLSIISTDNSQNLRVLDVGCSTAEATLSFFHDPTTQVWGLDIDSSRLDSIPQELWNGRFHRVDGSAWMLTDCLSAYPGIRFDRVIIANSLSYIGLCNMSHELFCKNLNMFFKQLLQHMCEGGFVVIAHKHDSILLQSIVSNGKMIFDPIVWYEENDPKYTNSLSAWNKVFADSPDIFIMPLRKTIFSRK